MILLKLNRNEKIDVLTIKKINSLIYKDRLGLLKFYRIFCEVLENKNEDLNIWIGNRKLISKEVRLFNFMDIESIIKCLKYEKGTIFFEYISFLINSIDIEIQDDFYNKLQIIVNSLLSSEKNISYDLDDNILKIIHNILNVKIINDNYENNINKYLNYLIERNENKLFIIFFDSNLMPITCNECSNVYYFDVSQNKTLKEYNIYINDDIKEFHYDILINEIEKVWPIQFNEDRISKIIDRFYRIYISDITYYTEDEDEIILNKVLNILYFKNRKIGYDLSKINDNIKSFLTN